MKVRWFRRGEISLRYNDVCVSSKAKMRKNSFKTSPVQMIIETSAKRTLRRSLNRMPKSLAFANLNFKFSILHWRKTRFSHKNHSRCLHMVARLHRLDQKFSKMLFDIHAISSILCPCIRQLAITTAKLSEWEKQKNIANKKNLFKGKIQFLVCVIS